MVTPAPLAWAFGGYSAGVDKSWVRNRPPDIDATTAGMLERQVRLITVHELGKGKPIDEDRVLTVTGDDTMGARHPHGKRLEGKLVSSIWSTSVDIPTGLSAWGGIARRLAVLPTSGEFTEFDKVAAFETQQDLADALITLAAGYAADVYKTGYRAPEGDVQSKREVIREMDPLSTWLDDLSDNGNGTTFEDLLVMVQEHVSRTISPQLFGRAVKASKKWELVRRRMEDGRQLRTLERK